jgi:hypothetical protein
MVNKLRNTRQHTVALCAVSTPRGQTVNLWLMPCAQTDEFSVQEVSFWQMKSGWGKEEYIHCRTMNERTGIAW